MEARTTITLWSTGIKHQMSIALHGWQLNRIGASKRFPHTRSDGGMVPRMVAGSISREATALIGNISGEAMRQLWPSRPIRSEC